MNCQQLKSLVEKICEQNSQNETLLTWFYLCNSAGLKHLQVTCEWPFVLLVYNDWLLFQKSDFTIVMDAQDHAESNYNVLLLLLLLQRM